MLYQTPMQLELWIQIRLCQIGYIHEIWMPKVGKRLYFFCSQESFKLEIWWWLDFTFECVVFSLVNGRGYYSSSSLIARLQLRQCYNLAVKRGVATPPPPTADVPALPTVFLDWNTWDKFISAVNTGVVCFMGWTLTDERRENDDSLSSLERSRHSSRTERGSTFLQGAWNKQSPGVKGVCVMTGGHLARAEEMVKIKVEKEGLN